MITTNESLLRVKCEPVKPNEVYGLISLLEEELKQSAINKRPGIGIAAPQIGIHKQAAIIRIDGKLNVNLINCKIENSYDEFLFMNEGCLSFPDLKVNTKRYNEIYVVGNLVYPHSFIATGLLSVAIQHELDHLNGIIMTDRAIKPIIKQPSNELCLCGSKIKFKKCCNLKGINVK